MSYRDPEKQKEANRLKAQRHREKVTPSERGVTPSAPSGGGVTPKIVTPHINPINGKPYGPAMLGVTAEQLTEYERKVNAPRVLVISELSTPHRDYLYRCLVNNKRGE